MLTYKEDELTDAQRVQLRLKKKPILQEMAKKNSQTNLRRGKNNSGSLECANLHTRKS